MVSLAAVFVSRERPGNRGSRVKKAAGDQVRNYFGEIPIKKEAKRASTASKGKGGTKSGA